MRQENKMCQKYLKFTTIEEAICWGKEHYGYWLPNYQIKGKLRSNYESEHPEFFLLESFSKEELRKIRQDALENKWFSFYCGGNFGLAINEKNRYGITTFTYPENDIEEMQKVMDIRLNQSCVPNDIWGYRFLEYKDLRMSTRKNHIHCGMTIEDKGYMGVGLVESALKEEFGTYDTLLKIMIPKGAKGLYIDLISNRAGEQELLFARESRLKVLFVYFSKGKRIIICKMMK